MSYAVGNYQLRYYKQLQNRRGEVIRLEILRRYGAGETIPPEAEIGDLQSILLEIQGAQGDVFEPVVKTQLRFTVVDSWDIPDETDGQGHVTVKHGNWEEFFTPDATLYMVRVRNRWSSTTWITRWCGYITPDSWRESLDYHGSITVTARDNIGHLQDIPFDLPGDVNGLVQISAFVEQALVAINLPMEYSINDTYEDLDEFEFPARGLQVGSGNTPLVDMYFCATAFKDKTYYDVLTALLDGIGYTLRYVDLNRVVLAPIRNLPMVGEGSLDETGEHSLVFFNGERSLDPAYKTIQEVLEYSEGEAEDIQRGIRFTGAHRGYNVYNHPEAEGHDYQNGGDGSGYGWLPGYGFFDGSTAQLTAELKEIDAAATEGYVMIDGNSSSMTVANAPTYKMRVITTAGVMKIALNAPLAGEDRGEESITVGDPLLGVANNNLKRVSLRISYTKGGATRSWNGESWGTGGVLVLEMDAAGPNTLEIPLGGCAIGNGGDLSVQIYDITYGEPITKEGIYARIESITFEAGDAGRLKSDTVTTVNDEAYNVRAERRPKVGALSRAVPMVLPQQYENVLYYFPNGTLTPMPYTVHWAGVPRELPLPAVIHMQMLTFHHVAMSVLEGDCTTQDGGILTLDGNWLYKGKKYILQGCTYDFLSNTIRGGIFREYVFYDNLYDEGFTVTLESAGTNKVAVIRAIADTTGMSVRDAKEIADNAPAEIIDGAPLSQANTIKAAVEAAGGTVTIEAT